LPNRTLRQPHAALADLCDGFFDDLAFVGGCPRVGADELPPLARKLLVHREHMTVVLEDHFGAPLELRVLAERRDARHYARRVLLTAGAERRVVEVGVMQMNLDSVSQAVRSEVLEKRRPLGEILVRHGVLRRISPRWYFRFPKGTPIADPFAPGDAPVYGRVGVIYCDEEPAIELLEVVASEKREVKSER